MMGTSIFSGKASRIRELFANLSTQPFLLQRRKRMFYGQAEFELTDPDGYGICIAEPLTEMSDLPTPVE